MAVFAALARLITRSAPPRQTRCRQGTSLQTSRACAAKFFTPERIALTPARVAVTIFFFPCGEFTAAQ
jgi:hypothetical protein